MTQPEMSRVGSHRVKKCLNLTGRVGSGQKVLESGGPDQVGSRNFRISRIGSGGVKRFFNLAAGVSSSQELLKSHGSG